MDVNNVKDKKDRIRIGVLRNSERLNSADANSEGNEP